jgi:hypothetical protein
MDGYFWKRKRLTQSRLDPLVGADHELGEGVAGLDGRGVVLVPDLIF